MKNIEVKSLLSEEIPYGYNFLIQTGAKNVMYCLYVINEFAEPPNNYIYICNLSEDLEVAKAKAIEYIQNDPQNADIDTIWYHENKMSDRAEQYYYLRMKSGKHEGKSIVHDLMTEDIKYVVWLLGLAKKKAKKINDMVETLPCRMGDLGWEYTLSKREKWLINNSDEIWQEYFKQFPKPKSTSTHVGSVGERMTVRMKLTKETGFDTQWGYTQILIFEDEDGNVFKYMGNGNWYTPDYDTVVSDDGDVAIRNDANDFFTVTFTVKSHDEYRDVKQTRMSRPKMAKVTA